MMIEILCYVGWGKFSMCLMRSASCIFCFPQKVTSFILLSDLRILGSWEIKNSSFLHNFSESLNFDLIIYVKCGRNKSLEWSSKNKARQKKFIPSSEKLRFSSKDFRLKRAKKKVQFSFSKFFIFTINIFSESKLS